MRLIFFYIERKIPIINPSNQHKLVWDLLQLIIGLILIFFIPITIIFNISFSNLIGQEFCIIFPLLLIMELLLNLTTGYFEKGQLITDRTLIINNWGRNMMIFDLLAILPVVIKMF